MQTLAEMRSSIDNIDSALLAMLSERFKVTRQVGHYKSTNNICAQDVRRETEQFQRISRLAEGYGLDADFAVDLFSVVLKQVVVMHKNIASDNHNSAL